MNRMNDISKIQYRKFQIFYDSNEKGINTKYFQTEYQQI